MVDPFGSGPGGIGRVVGLVGVAGQAFGQRHVEDRRDQIAGGRAARDSEQLHEVEHPVDGARDALIEGEEDVDRLLFLQAGGAQRQGEELVAPRWVGDAAEEALGQSDEVAQCADEAGDVAPAREARQDRPGLARCRGAWTQGRGGGDRLGDRLALRLRGEQVQGREVGRREIGPVQDLCGQIGVLAGAADKHSEDVALQSSPRIGREGTVDVGQAAVGEIRKDMSAEVGPTGDGGAEIGAVGQGRLDHLRGQDRRLGDDDVADRAAPCRKPRQDRGGRAGKSGELACDGLRCGIVDDGDQAAGEGLEGLDRSGIADLGRDEQVRLDAQDHRFQVEVLDPGQFDQAGEVRHIVEGGGHGTSITRNSHPSLVDG